MKKIFLIMLIILLIFSTTACGLGVNSLESFFSSIRLESDLSVAIIDETTDTVILNGVTYDVRVMLGKYYNNPADDMFFLELNGTLYGMHEYDFTNEMYHERIDIYALQIETGTLNVLYSSEVCPRGKTEMARVDAYYSDRNIFIYDGTCTRVFNVDTQKVSEFENQQIACPPAKYSVERIKDKSGQTDLRQIKVSDGNSKTTITVDYMAQRHRCVEDLLALENSEKTSSGVQMLSSFFYDAFVVGDKIYLVCRVLDEDGESNTLIFSYNYYSDTFVLIYHGFSSENPWLYVIPRE